MVFLKNIFSSMQQLYNFFWQRKINFTLTIFLLLNIILDVINQRFWLNDFRVYYEAASHLRTHQTIYGEAFGLGSGFYKYSPFAAFLFIPISLLNYSVAKIIFFCISSTAIITVFYYLQNWLQYFFKTEKTKNYFLISFFTLLICAVHLQRELHLGNVNMQLICLLVIAFHLIIYQKKLAAGILIGLATCFKPHFLILIPLFVLRKEWKILFTSIISVLLFLIFPAITLGWENNYNNLLQWLATMQTHNAANEGNEQTFLYMAHRFFNLPNSTFIWLSLIAATALGFGLLCLKHFKDEKENISLLKKDFAMEYFTLIAIVPNLVITDTEHFLFAMPIIFSLITFLFFTENSRLIIGISIVVLILFGLKITDVIGNDMADVYLQNSLLGISNLIIILLLNFIFEKQKQQLSISK